ncbi:uncharacterized protein LOC113789273 [Dermatophagoides pteronyssinus]|uniref:uncharacterized protein LOC113789273 n=1 Tax=Dermatophagoides pteronyssinus TaxID=6956 RepID=UPI003F67FA80
MSKFKIQARFLRMISFTYGFLGLQLHPIDRNDWKTILNVLMNITINLLAINGLLANSSLKSMAFDKPLLYQILRVCYEFIYPMTYLIVSIQYLLKGSKFIQNIDMLTRKTNDQWHYERFIWTIFITNSTYFVMNYQTIQKFFMINFTSINLNQIWRQFGVYFINARFHMLSNLIIYFQSSTIRLFDILIRKMHISNHCRNDRSELTLIINEMIDAAKHCDQIQKFTSINLLIMIPTMSINIIIRICIIQYYTITNQYNLLLQIIIFAIYLTIMSNYNRLIAERLSDIQKIITIQYWNDLGNFRPNNNLINEMIIIQKYDPSRYYESKKLFENDFIVRIYHFCSVDLDLIMGIILFIMNNVVFIIQTETPF